MWESKNMGISFKGGDIVPTFGVDFTGAFDFSMIHNDTELLRGLIILRGLRTKLELKLCFINSKFLSF